MHTAFYHLNDIYIHISTLYRLYPTSNPYHIFHQLKHITCRGGYKLSEQQDVVRLEIVDQPALHEETPHLLSSFPSYTDVNCMKTTAEIKLGSALIRISNNIDPGLLSQIIRFVEGVSC